MSNCGIWKMRQRLVAVVVEDDARTSYSAVSAFCTDKARWALITHIHNTYGLDCAFVISQAMIEQDTFAIIATQKRAHVWVVSNELIKNVCLVIRLFNASPKRFALMLARLPLCPLFRKYLKPIRLQIPLPL